MKKKWLAILMSGIITLSTAGSSAVFAGDFTDDSVMEFTDSAIESEVTEEPEIVFGDNEEISDEFTAPELQEEENDNITGAAGIELDEKFDGKWGDLTWKVTGNKTAGYTVTISGNGEMKNGSLPWHFNGNREVITGDIVRVIIESGVTSIAKSAFYGCRRLCFDNILMPNSLTTIGENAFRDCTNLTEFIIPEGVKEIDWNAFSGCRNLEKVTLPQSLIVINGGAFSSCEKLKNIEIPENVKTISVAAFQYCNNLTSVIVPKSLEVLSNSAFGFCSNLKTVYFCGSAPARLTGEYGEYVEYPFLMISLRYIIRKGMIRGQERWHWEME